MAYTYRTYSLPCDFAQCSNDGVTHVQARLRDHSRGGVREVLFLFVCLEHVSVGEPCERTWEPG